MDEPAIRSTGESAPPAAGETTSAAGSSSTAGRRSTLGIIFLTLFLDLAGFSIIFPLSPSLLEHYLAIEGRGGLLGGLVGWIEKASALSAQDPIYTAALFGGVLGSIYSLLQFIFSPIWGSLSDRVGRKPVLLVSVAGIAASYLLWAFSGNFLLFVVSRFLAGAMGGNISVVTAAAADITSRQDRAKAMGVVGAAFGLGFILGPAIGAALSHIDLSKHFPGLASIGINPFSAAALGAFALSAVNLVWVALRFQETLHPGARQPEARRPMNPLAFFQRFEFPGIRRTNIIWFIYLLAFTGMEFTLTFMAHRRFDYTPRKNAILFIFVGLIMALVQGGVVRRLVPRLGEKRVTAIGLALALPGFFLLGIADPVLLGSRGLASFLLYLGLAFMGVGNGLAQPSVTSLISLYAPPERQGMVIGIFRSLGAFSRILGPILATVLFWEFGAGAPYLLGTAILLAPLALVFGLPAPHKHA